MATTANNTTPDTNDTLIINAYCMRHGQKGSGPNDLAKHTDEGAEQVRQSARNNLTDVSFNGLYRSNLFQQNFRGRIPSPSAASWNHGREIGLPCSANRDIGNRVSDPSHHEFGERRASYDTVIEFPNQHCVMTHPILECPARAC